LSVHWQIVHAQIWLPVFLRSRYTAVTCDTCPAWHAFAGSLGVVPIVEVPVAALILGLASLVLAGNLLAALPAAVAARTRPGAVLRAE
jgi:hypothetical protein